MKREQGKTCLTEIDWDTWQAVDLATLLFVVESDRVLLIRKKTGLGAGKVNGPGGKIDPGETPMPAAVRECQEEIGITPDDPQLVGIHQFQFVDGYSIHVWVYRATSYSGELCSTVEADPLWCELDALPFDEMWADDRYWLPLAIDGTTFQGKWIFDDDAMVAKDLRTNCSVSDELPSYFIKRGLSVR